MLEKIALIAVWIIVPICILFFPHICSAIYFAFVVVIVADGQPDLALRTVLPFAAVLFLLLELSPVAGPVWAAKSSFLKDKRKRLLTHIGVMFVVVFGALISMSQIGLHNKAENGTIGLLFSFVICPAIGFVIGLGALLFRRYLFEDEEGFEKKRLEEERVQQEAAAAEAERQRLEAERQRQEAERARERAESIAKAKVERDRQAAAEKAKKNRLSEIKKNNEKAVDDFWALVTSEYGLDPAILQGLSAANSLNLDSEITTEEEVWVSNDKRIEAIENIVKSSGFSADGLKPPRFPYESALLEYAFSLDSPIFRCVDELHWGLACEVNGRVFPFEYIRRYSVDAEKVLDKLCLYYKRCLDTYQSDYGIIKSGLKGEYAVQSVLDMHAGAFIVVHDLRLEFPGKNGEVDSVETDTVVLAPNGIFAVEVKNYGSSGRYKIVVTGDGNWYKEYPPLRDGEGPKREVMKNPFAQNDRHIAYLERFINELLGRDMANWARVENIICLANDEVAIENDPDAKQTLTRVSNLYNQLTYDRAQKFTVAELEKIKAAFDEKGLPGKKYPLPDYSKQMKWAVDWYRYISQSLYALVDGIDRCAPEHLEFFDRILYK